MVPLPLAATPRLACIGGVAATLVRSLATPVLVAGLLALLLQPSEAVVTREPGRRLNAAEQSAPGRDVERLFTARDGRYTLDLPQGWRVEEREDRVVDLLAEDRDAACGIHWIPRPASISLDQFVQVFSSLHATLLLERGLLKEVLVRQPLRLAGGVEAVAQTVALHRGGMARELYALQGERAYLLMCETFEELWPRYGGEMERMLRSFSPLPAAL